MRKAVAAPKRKAAVAAAAPAPHVEVKPSTGAGTGTAAAVGTVAGSGPAPKRARLREPKPACNVATEETMEFELPVGRVAQPWDDWAPGAPWPPSSPHACWHCCERFDGPPRALAIHYSGCARLDARIGDPMAPSRPLDRSRWHAALEATGGTLGLSAAQAVEIAGPWRGRDPWRGIRSMRGPQRPAFKLHGNFCGWPCAFGFLDENRVLAAQRSKIVPLTRWLIRLAEGGRPADSATPATTPRQRVEAASSRVLLQRFGGPLSVEDLRGAAAAHTVYVPATVPCIPTVIQVYKHKKMGHEVVAVPERAHAFHDRLRESTATVLAANRFVLPTKGGALPIAGVRRKTEAAAAPPQPPTQGLIVLGPRPPTVVAVKRE